MKDKLVVTVIAAAMLAASGAVIADSTWQHAGAIGMRQFVIVVPAVSDDVKILKQAADKVCVPNKTCVVVFLSEGAEVPKKMPMTQAQKQSVIAQYFRNPSTGTEELLRRCKENGPKDVKCLR